VDGSDFLDWPEAQMWPACREGGTTIVFPLAIALNFNKIAATPALTA